jgi:hypothetical protein
MSQLYSSQRFSCLSLMEAYWPATIVFDGWKAQWAAKRLTSRVRTGRCPEHRSSKEDWPPVIEYRRVADWKQTAGLVSKTPPFWELLGAVFSPSQLGPRVRRTRMTKPVGAAEIYSLCPTADGTYRTVSARTRRLPRGMFRSRLCFTRRSSSAPLCLAFDVREGPTQSGRSNPN